MSDYLAHHGRLHMKWGVKNGPPYPLGSNVTKGYAKRQEAHDDYKKAHNKGEHKKSVKELSDVELRTRLNRLQMEQQYKNLSGVSIARGKKQVETALAVIGTATAAAAVVKKYAPKIKKAIDIGVEVYKANRSTVARIPMQAGHAYNRWNVS